MDQKRIYNAQSGHSPPRKQQTSEKFVAPAKTDMLPHWDSVDLCNAPGNAMHLVRPRKWKEDGLFTTLRTWIVHHQIGLALNLLLLLALTHIFFPRARQRTRLFFQLSYYDPSTKRYARGPEDLFYVLYWIVIFTGLRAAAMSYVLLPFAQWAGIAKDKPQVRFAEQAWLFLYYSVFWSLGMYLFVTSPYWLNLRELWTEFPLRLMDGVFKWYYLVQFAFWVQQIVVIHIEEPRKDHWQMLTHHIVTCALMFTSYGYYQQKVGNVILCIMDIVDVTFPAAKMLKYLGFQKLCDFAFGVFMLSWVVARHICYLMVCWSIYVDPPQVMTVGCYSSKTGAMLSSDGGDQIMTHILQPFVNPGGQTCYNSRMYIAFLSLLMFLQGITIMWFIMILRVAWNVIKGNGADDSRSDDEEEKVQDVEDFAEEDELSVEPSSPSCFSTATASISVSHNTPIEETVGVEEIHLKRKSSPRNRSRKSGSGGGLSIAGHSDRKELLGRIGCDKPAS